MKSDSGLGRWLQLQETLLGGYWGFKGPKEWIFKIDNPLFDLNFMHKATENRLKVLSLLLTEFTQV